MQSDPSSELHVCFKRSYDSVLRHHHTFLIRSVVSASSTYLLEQNGRIQLPLQVAIRAVPRRDDFYMRIAQGGSTEKLDIELAKWLIGLATLVSQISAFLEQGGYGKV